MKTLNFEQMEKVEGGKDVCKAMTTADAVIAGVGLGLWIAAGIVAGGVGAAIIGAFAESVDVAGYAAFASDAACYIAA